MEKEPFGTVSGLLFPTWKNPEPEKSRAKAGSFFQRDLGHGRKKFDGDC